MDNILESAALMLQKRPPKLLKQLLSKLDYLNTEDKEFIKNLSSKLYEWTNDRWIISLSKNVNAKSIYEQNIEQKTTKLAKFKKSDTAKKIEDAFPDAKLLDIEDEKND